MSASKLLQVFGAGPWQLPVIRCARELGHRVLAVDRDADRPGYVEADLHERCDLADASGQIAVARRHRIDGVLCATTDVGVAAAAAVADALGLPGIGLAAARACTDKAELARLARAAGLAGREPMHWRAGEAIPAWTGPVAVKPVDNQGGRGVRQVLQPAELAPALEHALTHSRRGEVLVDPWLEGTEYIVDAFVNGSELLLLGIASKRRDPANPTVAESIDYAAGERLQGLLSLFQPAMRKLIDACALRQGICHAEFIVGNDCQPLLLDFAARGGGAHIFRTLLPAISGVDVTAASIQCALGLQPTLTPGQRRAGCIRFLRAETGVFAALDGVDAALTLPGVLAVEVAAQPGQTIGAVEHKDQRPAYLVCIADDEVELAARCDAALRQLHIRYED